MKLVLKITLGIIIAVVLLIAGCSALVAQGVDEATEEKDWSVEIHAPANGQWSGHVGDHSIDGTGPSTEEFSDMAITAVVVQKSSPGRWPLRITLLRDGEVVDEATTKAEFGVATVEGEDL